MINMTFMTFDCYYRSKKHVLIDNVDYDNIYTRNAPIFFIKL